MLHTYKATIQNNHVEWDNTANGFIESDIPVPVLITVLDDSVSEENKERGKCMVSALESLAQINACSDINDPVAWERKLRHERELPGRLDADR